MKDYIEELLQARQGHKNLVDKINMLKAEIQRIKDERVYYKMVIVNDYTSVDRVVSERYISKNKQEIQQDFESLEKRIEGREHDYKEQLKITKHQKYLKEIYKDFIKGNWLIKLIYKFSDSYAWTIDDDPMGK